LGSGVHGEDHKLHLCHFSLLIYGSAGDGLNLGAAGEKDLQIAHSCPPLPRCCATQLPVKQPSTLGWEETMSRLCRSMQAVSIHHVAQDGFLFPVLLPGWSNSLATDCFTVMAAELWDHLWSLLLCHAQRWCSSRPRLPMSIASRDHVGLVSTEA